MSVTPITQAKADRMLRARILTPRDRLEALLLATLNDDKAELCRADQPALRAFFERNAAAFRKYAGDAE